MNCVLAGFVDTLSGGREVPQAIPMRRVAGPEEVARVAAFLLSDDAAYITGQSVRADGGLTREPLAAAGWRRPFDSPGRRC